jgi:hypothetical protein
MTTVLAVYSRRRCIALCDARCHNALQPTQLKEYRTNACMCICLGANHGLGYLHAYYNVTVRHVGLTPEALETFAQRRGLNAGELVVIDRTRVRSELLARRWARKMLAQPHLVAGKHLFACEAVT